MNLGIVLNKAVNSFVGHLQGIPALKISEAPTFTRATGFSGLNVYSVIL
jgi:hypothetical protein